MLPRLTRVLQVERIRRRDDHEVAASVPGLCFCAPPQERHACVCLQRKLRPPLFGVLPTEHSDLFFDSRKSFRQLISLILQSEQLGFLVYRYRSIPPSHRSTRVNRRRIAVSGAVASPASPHTATPSCSSSKSVPCAAPAPGTGVSRGRIPCAKPSCSTRHRTHSSGPCSVSSRHVAPPSRVSLQAPTGSRLLSLPSTGAAATAPATGLPHSNACTETSSHRPRL